MKELIVATNNISKIQEVKKILNNIKIISLEDINLKIEFSEDKKTFEENAIEKAKKIVNITKKACIADDSGLCIEYLNDFPGVETKRFLGREATQEDRNNYLIKKLNKVINKEKRKAKMVTCIAFVDNYGNEKFFKGFLEGYISNKRRGKNGFGFDEIFEIQTGRTLAELSEEEKNKISSRKIALEALKNFLINYTYL